jgi:hypothetical protein
MKEKNEAVWQLVEATGFSVSSCSVAKGIVRFLTTTFFVDHSPS